MNGLIGLFSLSALLLTVSGQFPNLSLSFSFQGNFVLTVNGQVTTGSIILAFDITRRLAYSESAGTLSDGSSQTFISLVSENDNTVHSVVNGVCNETPFASANNSFNTSIWDLYAAGTESPPGTFTYTQGIATQQLTIVNGEPAVINSTSSFSVYVITVTNFDNTTPAFSTFSFPSECSQFNCTACYNSQGQFPSLSPSYSYRGDLIQTINGQVTTATYIQAVDITRRLQYTEVSVTLSDGSSVTIISLYSENDNTSYSVVNGVCNETTFLTDINLLDHNIWDPYAAGTESPPGTFTYTAGDTTFVLTIVNGEPAVFTSTSSTLVTVITVTNFEMPPAFSTFSLPSECSQFNCTACYSSPGQFPSLSPSYSYRGDLVETRDGQVTTGTTIRAFDLTRRLTYYEITYKFLGGSSVTYTTLFSVNDNTLYVAVNGVCNVTNIPSANIPPDINTWDLYADATESPPGTFTYTEGSTTQQVTIVNGVPAVFTTTDNFSVTVITVTDFEMPPAFSIFSLPSECSRFTCTACYNSQGQFPDLSPSYSFRGNSVATTRDGRMNTSTIIQAIDITRRLSYFEIIGGGSSFILLYSENDDTVYASVNGVCTVSTFPSTYNPIDNNMWEPYAAATESPAGTFTYTQGDATFVLTIVNGEPAVFTTTSILEIVTTDSILEVVITVTNFEMPPAFSTFSLPSECSQFNCTACYNSAVSVSISVLLLLTTLLLYLFSTH